MHQIRFSAVAPPPPSPDLTAGAHSALSDPLAEFKGLHTMEYTTFSILAI